MWAKKRVEREEGATRKGVPAAPQDAGAAATVAPGAEAPAGGGRTRDDAAIGTPARQDTKTSLAPAAAAAGVLADETRLALGPASVAVLASPANGETMTRLALGPASVAVLASPANRKARGDASALAPTDLMPSMPSGRADEAANRGAPPINPRL